MTDTPGTPAILAPIDGSRFSEDALPLAATVARTLSADIHVARVHELFFTPPVSDMAIVPPIDPRVDADMRKTQSEELARTAASLRTAAGRPVHATLLDGPVSLALREHADTVGAALIIMTTHGRGGFARTLLGSVATDLVHDGRQPVLLVRPRDGHAPAAPDLIDHALIPLDGSALSEAAIAPALWLLRDRGTVTLFRAVAPVSMEMAPSIVPLAIGDSHLLDEEVRTAREYLEHIATTLRARGLTVHITVVTHPSAATAIVDEILARPPHFVSMATHGRSGIPRMVMGSVTDTVLRHVDVPVLLFRPTLTGTAGAVTASSSPARATVTTHT